MRVSFDLPANCQARCLSLSKATAVLRQLYRSLGRLSRKTTHPPTPFPEGKGEIPGVPVFERAAALENRHFRKFPAPGGGVKGGETGFT